VAYRAASPQELRTTLERALADEAPVIIDVPVVQGSEVSPWQFLHPPPPV
jgi:acetolactate synthase-1/2/3 large subunit